MSMLHGLGHRLRKLARGGGLALCAAAMAAGTQAAAAADKVTFLTDWYSQAEHGGFYAALAEGIYAEHGLDVEIRMGGPQVNMVQLLAAGSVDFIYGHDVQTLFAVEQGIPSVVVSVIMREALVGFLTHDDVHGPGDLVGKDIHVSTTSQQLWWPWLRERFGLDDSQLRPYVGGIQPFLVNPNAVTQGYVGHEPFHAANAGAEVNFIRLAEHGYTPHGNAIVTRRDVIDANPDLVARFVRASAEGWKRYMENPGPANELIKEANPRMTDEELAYTLQVLKDIEALNGREAATGGIGTLTAERFEQVFRFLVDEGLIGENVDWNQAFTTEFVRDMRVMP